MAALADLTGEAAAAEEVFGVLGGYRGFWGMIEVLGFRGLGFRGSEFRVPLKGSLKGSIGFLQGIYRV